MHGRVDLVARTEDMLPPNVSGIDLRQFIVFFLCRWKLVAAPALTVILPTLVLLFTLMPKYTATAEVLLEPRNQSIFGADGVLPKPNLESGSVDSQISVSTSFDLLQRPEIKARAVLLLDTVMPGVGREGEMRFKSLFAANAPEVREAIKGAFASGNAGKSPDWLKRVSG